ncbi:hypothetical protein CSKR_112022 [Clonorchis sinensis]|uniref:Uncharacterized protein n=2 Tax=Clonorchis sinensis TaxID=79923 RepID=G7Y7F3_CLOSI|nr:hypothetical protein CSKR_112022 [Clonorchis sinensis]GAA48888.1 hypothetical protein CLF_102178 [Clonorchis sinensis]
MTVRRDYVREICKNRYIGAAPKAVVVSERDASTFRICQLSEHVGTGAGTAVRYNFRRAEKESAMKVRFPECPKPTETLTIHQNSSRKVGKHPGQSINQPIQQQPGSMKNPIHNSARDVDLSKAGGCNGGVQMHRNENATLRCRESRYSSHTSGKSIRALVDVLADVRDLMTPVKGGHHIRDSSRKYIMSRLHTESSANLTTGGIHLYEWCQQKTCCEGISRQFCPFYNACVRADYAFVRFCFPLRFPCSGTTSTHHMTIAKLVVAIPSKACLQFWYQMFLAIEMDPEMNEYRYFCHLRV